VPIARFSGVNSSTVPIRAHRPVREVADGFSPHLAEARRICRAAAVGRPYGTMHLDALRDLKNVNTHLVAAAAYPVLENIGELLPSRIRHEDEDQSLMTHRRIG
jgi:hypothetical protein